MFHKWNIDFVLVHFILMHSDNRRQT